jgi:hypothetical protein
MLRDAQLDATAGAAGEEFHIENVLADLSPVAHEGRPPAAHAADSKMFDAQRL